MSLDGISLFKDENNNDNNKKKDIIIPKNKQEIIKKIKTETNNNNYIVINKLKKSRPKNPTEIPQELISKSKNGDFKRTFDRLDGESNLSWDMFLYYSNLPKNERSIDAIFIKFGGSFDAIKELCRKYYWFLRARDYDLFIAYKKKSETVKKILQTRRKVNEVIDIYIDEFIKILRENPRAVEISTKDFATLVSIKNKLDEDKITKLLQATDIEPDIIEEMFARNDIRKQSRIDKLDRNSENYLIEKYGSDRLGIAEE